MKNYNSSISFILSNVNIADIETIKLQEAFGRVLAQDITAKYDIPYFDNSAMDGYAVRYADIKNIVNGNAVVLEEIDAINAGVTTKKRIRQNQTIRIMTGAKIPAGADYISPIENTGKNGNQITIFKLNNKSNIRKKASDIKKDALIVNKGRNITGQMLAMLAAQNYTQFKVYKKLKIGVITTGDELIAPGAKLKDGLIFNSNTYSLVGLINELGMEFIDFGVVKDNYAAIKTKINYAREKKNNLDALIISGGMSVGDRDFVKQILYDLGMDNSFWKSAVKPGKPLLFGKLKNLPVFGLPGNPSALTATFHLFVKPALLKIQGYSDYANISASAILTEDIKKTKGKRYFIQAQLFVKNKRWYAQPLKKQAADLICSAIDANCYIMLDEKTEFVKKETLVEIIKI